MSSSGPVNINGWSVFAHPLFLTQLEKLTRQVERLQHKDPSNYRNKNATKRLAAIHKLVFEVIPDDPSLAQFRLGNTLGSEYRHWFRAKFYQQYRLFYRFHQESRIIIYAWLNDEKSKRAYESKTAAYLTFEKMINGGNPPDDWSSLLKAAKAFKLDN